MKSSAHVQYMDEFHRNIAFYVPFKVLGYNIIFRTVNFQDARHDATIHDKLETLYTSFWLPATIPCRNYEIFFRAKQISTLWNRYVDSYVRQFPKHYQSMFSEPVIKNCMQFGHSSRRDTISIQM